MSKRVCDKCGNPLDRRNQSGVCRNCNPITGAAASVVPKAKDGEFEGIRVNGNEAVVGKLTDRYVHTLDELIEVCGINTAEWEIVSYECKASQQASVPRSTRDLAKGQSSWQRPTTVPVVTQLFHVSAKMRRPSGKVQTMRAIHEALIADLKATPTTGTPAMLFAPNRGYLFEFAPFDLHMGKLAWGEETVTDYDLNHATDLFKQSLEYHLERALALTGGRIEQILFPFGNDVAHVDGKRAQTTAGTPMDADSRYVKIYRRIVSSHRWALQRLAQVAPVHGICIPGNHDELTSFHLGEILAAIHENDDNITIDNGARLRKYYQFGTNLFGFTHGDSERVAELPLIMAREVPQLWAESESREWHIGHKHIKEKVEVRAPVVQDLFSDKGVRVRRLTSLSAHDFWHTRHGYMDRRACEAFIYHRTAGYCGELSANVDHFTGQPLFNEER